MPDYYTIEAYFSLNPEVAWMIIGGIFFVIEVLTPGIMFLFSALAALSLGGLMAFGVLEPESLYLQFAYFFGLIVLWALVLWKPMKNFMKAKTESYEPFIGTSGIVCNGSIAKDRTGIVKWSGVNMRAMLSPDSKFEEIAEGKEVWVHKMDKSILIVDSDMPNNDSDNILDEDTIK